MKILKDICRDLFNDLAGIEALCTEAIYATEKQIKESHILDDIRYSADFRTMAASYENKKNFMLLIKRELQEEALLLAQGKTFTDRELVKISRLFLKESKSASTELALSKLSRIGKIWTIISKHASPYNSLFSRKVRFL